jgi:hypothetical protein
MAIDILSLFDDQAVSKERDTFMLELGAKCEEERVFCQKQRQRVSQGLKPEGALEPVMTPTLHHEVEELVKKCRTAYHIESLRRYVLRDCIVPTQKEVDELADRLLTDALT